LLRPSSFLANARDIADLKNNLTTQSARYSSLVIPIVIMAGSRDMIVPPRHHARIFADAVPHAKLVVLPGIGHMLHHVAAERVIAEIEEITARYSAALSSPT
jgi:pimeloyl-ACP methyl ester carboxylesterase